MSDVIDTNTATSNRLATGSERPHACSTPQAPRHEPDTNVAAGASLTDKVVNLGPETMEQDMKRIRDQSTQHLLGSPELLEIAEAVFREIVAEKLVYRLHMESVSLHSSQTDGEHVAPQYNMWASIFDRTRDLFFDNDGELSWVGADAQRIKHLEVIMQMEPHSMVEAPCQEAAEAEVQDFSAALHRAFPALERLVVRLTTYRIGDKLAQHLDPATGKWCDDGEWTALLAEMFSATVCGVLAAVDGYQSPGLTKEIIFHQKDARDWRTWRDGPLEQPLLDLQRADFGSVVCTSDFGRAAWQMMDLPSCRVVF